MSPPNAFRCAPWTRSQEVDPVGSAPRFDELIIVEVPLPWPKDVALMPWLSGLDCAPRTRFAAVAPRVDRGPGVMVTRWCGTSGVDYLVDQAELRDLLLSLVEGRAPAVEPVGPAPRELLVCGHGARDRCCGSLGTRVFTEAFARGLDVRVRRSSHLGGHRFAPTALTLPDARHWAWVDDDLLARLVTCAAAPASLREHYRGSASLDPPAQAVEREVFERLGWSWPLETVQDTEVHDHPAPGRTTVTLTWPEGRAVGVVEVRRRIPVLDCGEPPESAKKSSDEYRIVDFELETAPTGALQER